MEHIKRTIQDCQKWAEAKHGFCLSSHYINANTRLQWQCEKGHIWWTSPNKVRIGSWCPECHLPKITIEKCYETAISRGGQCLEKQYINNTTHMKFQCEYKHQWSTSWQSICQGSWCPECGQKASHDKQRLSLQFCLDLAKEHNGECLSKEYLNADSLYLWKCEHGHEWGATYSSIANGSWCKKCFDTVHGIKMRNSIEDAHEIAKIRGGVCLSTEYISAFKKLQWKCGICDHEWEANFNNTQRGRWCPNCQLSKHEKEVRTIVEIFFNKPFPKRRFKFEDRRFELDCYCEELKLGIEYDGEQHFLPVSYWGGNEGLIKNQERDQFKDRACKELGITLIRVPYTQKLNLKEFLLDLLPMV